MIDASNSLLNNNNDEQSRYGTFSEPSSATAALQKSLSKTRENNVECGQKYFKNPIAGCATFLGTVPFPTTLVVKNDASTARDNCSIERNFLSWLRLSMGLLLVGMSYYLRLEIIPPPPVPAGNVRDDDYSTVLGVFFIFLGSFVLIWALVNYFQFQRMLADRYMTVQHEYHHFLVAAFIGFTIFMASVFNMLTDESDRKE